MLNRLNTGAYEKQFMENIYSITPVISFTNQTLLALFWIQFPLKKGFMDFNDPLIRNRSLYRRAHVAKNTAGTF